MELTKTEGPLTEITAGSGFCSSGDPVVFRNSKSGELCERFNEQYLIRKGKIVDKLPTYRGESLSFL